MKTIVERLEEAGFQNPFTYRTGPCDVCDAVTTTYWDPAARVWQCESCVYGGGS